MPTEYPSYFSWYQQTFSKYSAECYFNMKQAGEYVIQLLESSNEDGRNYLSSIFNLCPSLPDANAEIFDDEIQQFLFYIMEGLPVQADPAVYGHPITVQI